MTEYIGYKDTIGEGLCNMGLTDEEIIRCRDCEHAVHFNGSWLCLRLYIVDGDPAYVESLTHLEIGPDGYCAWAVRRQ